jgi:hypothetical protein
VADWRRAPSGCVTPLGRTTLFTPVDINLQQVVDFLNFYACTWYVAENKEVPDCNIGVPPVRKYASYHTLRGFSPGTCSGFLPQGKLTGWVRINTVKKVISQLL